MNNQLAKCAKKDPRKADAPITHPHGEEEQAHIAASVAVRTLSQYVCMYAKYI